MKQVLSIQEASKKLGISVRTIRRAIAAGTILCGKDKKGKYIFDKKQVEYNALLFKLKKNDQKRKELLKENRLILRAMYEYIY